MDISFVILFIMHIFTMFLCLSGGEWLTALWVFSAGMWMTLYWRLQIVIRDFIKQLENAENAEKEDLK